MKAQVLHKYDPEMKEKVWVTEQEMPDPKLEKSSDVIVKIGAAGVCRTDLHIIEGAWKQWTEFSNKYALGDKVEGQIKSITDFGIFVGLEGDIDGLIHLSDISDAEDPKDALDEFKKGDKLNCLVFAVDADRERISLRLSE